MAPRRRDVPAEGSWRLIDGENDSFDMSIADPIYSDDPISPPSSGLPSSGFPTQQGSFSLSQNRMSFNSQDSIRDFANYQDDEQVILREPFRPSLPSTAGLSVQRPEVQLRMPRVEANGFVANRAAKMFRGGGAANEDEWRSDEETLFDSMERTRRRPNGRRPTNDKPTGGGRTRQTARLLYNYIAAPVAMLILAILVYQSDLTLQSITSQLKSVSLSPLLQLPKYANLHFPLSFDTQPSKASDGVAVSNIDFSDLIHVQSKLEHVLVKSSHGLSMPLELKRSEMATRSLRSLLKESDVPSKDELIRELNSYIQKVGRASSDLQTFYIHVGSSVDSIIDVNRWTLRHIRSLSIEPESTALSTILSWSSWLFNPFRSSHHPREKDRILLDKYAEHIILVQTRLEKLVDEGTALSFLLYHTQAHLSNIYEQAKRSSRAANLKSDSLLSSIWAYIVSMMEEQQRNLGEQIALLKKVDAQYASTISHLLMLIEELKDIQAELADLLQRSDEPHVVWGEEPAVDQATTLGEQFDIIQKALRQLESARRTATEIENRTSETHVSSVSPDEE